MRKRKQPKRGGKIKKLKLTKAMRMRLGSSAHMGGGLTQGLRWKK